MVSVARTSRALVGSSPALHEHSIVHLPFDAGFAGPTNARRKGLQLHYSIQTDKEVLCTGATTLSLDKGLELFSPFSSGQGTTGACPRSGR